MYVFLILSTVVETNLHIPQRANGFLPYVDFLQINVVTQRGFVPVDERMRVIDANGKLVCC